jgi:hypothetical protein
MSRYQLSPENKHIEQATPGLSVYLLGSLNRLVAPTRMRVTAVASSVAAFTYTVTVIEGNLPVAGQLLYVQGDTNNAQFNINGIAIASVSFADVPEDGIGTVTVTKAGSFVAKVASVAEATAPQNEIGETLAPGAPFTSAPCSIQSNTGPNNARSIRFDVGFPTAPGGVTVTAQTADFDLDSEYSDLTTVASLPVAPAQTVFSSVFVGAIGNFVRYRISGLAANGGNYGTIVGKVTV